MSHPFWSSHSINKIASILLLMSVVLSCSKQSEPTRKTSSEEAEQASSNSQHAIRADKLKALQLNAPQGELSLNAMPTYYQLDMIIDPGADKFSGHAKVNISLNNDSSGIWLHGKDLQVSSVTLSTANARAFAVTYTQVLDSGVAYIEFGQIVKAGDISLTFDYQADFDTNLSGLFKVEEQGDSYVLAKSESIQARKYLPGFDQPGFKSPFLISLTIPKDLKAISNTSEVSRVDVDDQFNKIQFAETRSTPTYLLSIAVGPFDIIDKGVIPKNSIRDYDIPLRAVARRGRAKDMNFIMDITPKYLELFEQALVQPYPFKKLDIIAAPQWPSGATELSAAITYREQRVLLGDSPAPGAKLSIMNTHAHEIAHMWFGNLVTPPWWDDLWLKEGFATWATPVILSQFEPEAGHELDALISNFKTMNSDALATTRAIREPILKNDNIRNAYDSITYRKSQAIIHMVDSYFGSEKFRKAMGKYVAQFADGIADSNQFYQSIAEQTGENALTNTFRQFAEQKGVPLMETTVQCKPSQPVVIEFSQSRYRPLGSQISGAPEWTVPVCVRYDDGSSIQKNCGLISPQKNKLELTTSQCPDWLMPNADGNGYYRWQLNERYLNALFDNYQSLNEGERIALLDNIISAFDAGKVNKTMLLKAIEVSTKSNVRQIVEMPLSKLGYYLNFVFDDNTAQQVINKIKPWYLFKLEQLDSLQANSTLSDSDQLLKNNLLKFLATKLKHHEIRAQLISQAQKFIDSKGNKNYLSSDLYTAALTIAVQEIGQSFFDKLLKARGEIDDPKFDDASARALGTLKVTDIEKEASLIEKIHHYALSDKIGSRESYSMISSMLSEKSMRDIHWQWFKQNLSLILEKIPAQWRRRSPRLANVFCEQSKMVELEHLFEKYADKAPGSGLALAQTKEAILLCASLKESL